MLLRRTFKCLLYASEPVFNQVRQSYYRVTHRRGVPCVRDRTVLRRVSDQLIGDGKVLRMFSEMHDTRKFHSDDLTTVYMKYI